jgi:cobyric acid synthase
MIQGCTSSAGKSLIAAVLAHLDLDAIDALAGVG